MDQNLIAEKLESLRRCVQRVQTKCPPTPEELMEDPDLQDIISLNLRRVVQLCVDIAVHILADLEVKPPDTMGAAFDALMSAQIISAGLAVRLKKAVGFRNIAIHNYKEIDWAIVHSIAATRLADFSEFARVIALRLDQA